MGCGDRWIVHSAIREQRIRISRLLEDSPSLKRNSTELLEIAYRDAVKLFEDETGISGKKLPQACPYSLESVMDEELLPE